ncbi:MAG TPA: hypothetical protein VNL70_08955 [Tepidisphaeraceae bacterium]|nr:hypothetical protein [Tepidisphaeraceae bacterium]
MKWIKASARTTAIGAALVGLAVVGCSKDRKDRQVAEMVPDERTLNTMMVRAALEQDARNAVAAERIIYSHHFHPATASLNELGERQVQVLAEALRDQPEARVSVVQGEAGPELYKRRLEAVRARFAEAGADTGRLHVGPGVPGGPGISSELIWRSYQSAAQNGDNGGGRGAGSSGSMSGRSSSGSSGSGRTARGASGYPAGRAQ